MMAEAARITIEKRDGPKAVRIQPFYLNGGFAVNRLVIQWLNRKIEGLSTNSQHPSTREAPITKLKPGRRSPGCVIEGWLFSGYWMLVLGVAAVVYQMFARLSAARTIGELS